MYEIIPLLIVAYFLILILATLFLANMSRPAIQSESWHHPLQLESKDFQVHSRAPSLRPNILHSGCTADNRDEHSDHHATAVCPRRICE
jgi:hypothetical protein